MSALADARDFAEKVAKLAKDAQALSEHPHVARYGKARIQTADVLQAIKPMLRSATWTLASLELAALRMIARPQARSLILKGIWT